jgi:hypothetical protein
MSRQDSEITPLLRNRDDDAKKRQSESTIFRLLICVFVISLSVAFTWVP